MVTKSCIQPSYTPSNEFLYTATVGHPKTRFVFIKDVIDSLTSDYKEIETVSVARNQGIANLPGEKEKDCIVCSNRNIEILGCCPAGSVLPHGEKVPL